MATVESYNIDLSAAFSSIDIPVGALVLVADNVSTSAIRLSIRPLDASIPILADIRRTSIYDGGAVESQTYNNTLISGRTSLDDLVYSLSQEMHWMRIRQQDPNTNLWSMCEIRTFASAGGARTSICINWIYTGVTFQVPSEDIENA